MVNTLLVFNGIRSSTITHQQLINGVTVTETINNTESPFRFGKIASSKMVFQFNTDLFDVDKVASSNRIVWVCKMMNENMPVIRDIFYVYDIEVHNKVATVTAYNMPNLWEVSAYEFLSSYSGTGGIAISSFITSLLSWWATTYNFTINYTISYNIILTNIQNQKVFPELMDITNIQDITVRQLIEYCAEIMNCFVIVRGDNTGEHITFRGLDLNSVGHSVDNTMYVSADIGYWSIPGTNAFVWGSVDGMGMNLILSKDANGQISAYNIMDQGTKTVIFTESSYIRRQIYYLEANPLVNYAVSAFGNYAAVQLGSQIINMPDYYAGEVVLLNDYGWDIGDKMVVDNKTMFIMSKTIQPSGVVFSSTGSMDRNFQESRRGGYLILKYNQQT